LLISTFYHKTCVEDIKGEFMINARVQLDHEANRIINMFKAKYDLKD